MQDFGYQKDDEQKKFSGSVKKTLLIVATLFSITCFVYITINAYYFVYKDGAENVETIKSPEGPIKISEDQQVVNQDGMQIDRTIYEDIFGHKKSDAKMKEVKIRNSPEPAMPPKQGINTEDLPTITNVDTAPLSQRNVEQEKVKRSASNVEEKMIVYSSGSDPKGVSKDLLTKQDGERKIAELPIIKNKKRAVRVQLAAMASQTAAKEYWKNLNHLHGGLFSGLKSFTEEVNLGKRGLFYRLQVGNFFNQVEAEEFCSRYVLQSKKSRADCIVVE